jgi:hypothetical protein
MASRQLATCSQNAQQIYQLLEERYSSASSILHQDNLKEEGSDCGFLQHVGTLSDFDATMEESMMVLLKTPILSHQGRYIVVVPLTVFVVVLALVKDWRKDWSTVGPVEKGRRNLCLLHGMISEFGTEKREIIEEINKLSVV